MESGNFFENVFKVVKDAFVTFWSYVKDYWKNFLNNPSGFIEKHTFVVLAVLFILILIIVLIFNLCRNATDRREAKKRKLEKLIAELKEEELSDVMGVKTIEEIKEPLEETNEEITQDIVEPEEKGDIQEVPLPTVVNDEEEKEIPMEEPVQVTEEIDESEEEPKKEIPEYEFVAEVRFINPTEKKEEENVPEVRVEVSEPTLYKDEKAIISNDAKEDLNLPFENEELDLDFFNDVADEEVEEVENPSFDPIPELRALERDNVNSFEETIYDEEPEIKAEPIVMEKIEVIKVNPAQKFGLKNIDTNRQGKTFTYDELDKLIKD